MEQIYERSVLVEDISYETDDVEEIEDKLTIHFSKSENGGGDVEKVICPFGGAMTRALIVFETADVLKTIIKASHIIGDQKVSVKPLPPVFNVTFVEIDEFYWKILPQDKAQKLVDKLEDSCSTTSLRSIQLTGNEIQTDFSHVKGIEYNVLESIGVSNVIPKSEGDSVVERSAHIYNIPYITDEVEELKEEIKQLLRVERISEVDTILCSIKGDLHRAIIVFKSSEDCNQFLSQNEYTFHDESFKAEALPQIFKYVVGRVHNFYLKMIPKIKQKQLAGNMRGEFGANFTTDCSQLKGSLSQVTNAHNYLLDCIGLTPTKEVKYDRELHQPEDHEYRQRPEARNGKSIEDHDYGQRFDSRDGKDSEVHDYGHRSDTQDGKGSEAHDHDHDVKGNEDVWHRPDTTNRKDNASSSYDKADVGHETKMEKDDGKRNKSPSSLEQIDINATESRQLHADLIQDSKSKDTSNLDRDRSQTSSLRNSDILIDRMIYKYMKIVNKSDINKIEKGHDVKIRMSTRESEEGEMYLLELKTRKKGVDSSKARADFDDLQSKIMKTTKKVSISFKGVEKSKHAKVQEKIQKKFPEVVISWDEDNENCILFGYVSVVETAADELSESIAIYESMLVDEIAFKYLSVVHSDELKDMNEKNGVMIELQLGATADVNQQVIYIKPNKALWKKKCKLDDVKKAKNDFIDLYQNVFFKLKRTAIKCTNTQEDVIRKAVHDIEQRHKVIVSRSSVDDIIICTEETIAEQVVKEFRTLAGLVTTRKLKKSSPNTLDVNPHFTSQRQQTSTSEPPGTKTMTVYKTRKGIEVKIQTGDITIAQVDLIVNAANKNLRHGGGVAGAISKAAGPEMQKYCRRLLQDRPPLHLGECVVTDSYKLPCKNILHIVGPIYFERKSDAEFYNELKYTFLSALQHASSVIEAKTIAIPLISSGIYGGPKRMCAQAALDAIDEFDREQYQTIRTIRLINLDDPSSQELMDAHSSKDPSSQAPMDSHSSEDPPSQALMGAHSSKLYPSVKPVETVQNQSAARKMGNKLELVFITDDITKQDVDIIVNPTDEALRNTMGVSHAISNAAGSNFKQHCNLIMKQRKNVALQIGDIIETTGFQLRCKHVLHLCSPFFFGKGKYYEEKYEEEVSQSYMGCLSKANSIGVQSIAVPIIGAGQGGCPKDLCAKAFVKAIKEFQDHERDLNLRLVVIISIDKEAVDIVKRMTESLTAVNGDSQIPNNMSLNDNSTHQVANQSVPRKEVNTLELVIKADDITKQDVDIIVNPTDSALWNTMGVASAIAKAAGRDFQNHCQSIMHERRNAALQTGEVIKTRGFLLKCKTMLHVRSPYFGNGANYKQKYQEDVSKTYIRCLSEANSTQGVQSIAVPIIGAGQSGCPKDLCAQALVKAIKEFEDRERNLNLRLLVAVSFDKETVDIVKRMAESLSVVDEDSQIPSNLSPSNLSPKTNPTHQVTQDAVNNLKTKDPLSALSDNKRQIAGEERASSHSNTSHHGNKDVHTLPSKTAMSDTNTQDYRISSRSNRRYSNAGDNNASERYTENRGTSSSHQNHGSSTFADNSTKGTYTGTASAVLPKTYSEKQAYDGAKASVTFQKPTNIVEPTFVSQQSQHPQCNNCYIKNDLKQLEGCNHMFCTNCITRCVAPNSKCAKEGCGALYCVVNGQNPVPGTMTYYIDTHLTLSNTEGNGAVVIEYNFPDGTLSFNAPRYHVKRYKGNRFTAYLPNCEQGVAVVWLLRTAFIAGFSFDVGHDQDSNLVVKWSGRISHKSNVRGGFGNHGYPDSGYIEKVTKQLEKCCVRSSLSSADFVKK